jgi:hypothetical protein
MDTAAVLTALAELAPAGPRREQSLDAVGGRAMQWLVNPDHTGRHRAVERLAAMDVLHRDERLLRRGWAWVLGKAEVDGARRTVRLPLLSEPVRMRKTPTGYWIRSAGDLEFTPLVTDRGLAARLESAQGAGTAAWVGGQATRDWLREAAAAAGFPVTATLLATPDELTGARLAERWPPEVPDELIAVAGAALYVARDVFSGGVQDTLLNWSGRSGLEDTALASVYGTRGDGPPGDGPPGEEPSGGYGEPEVRSPLPLTAAQAEVVCRARTERVAVVSGPPGSGKSHAVVAAALDVVDRGGSVLLATQSGHAADVLGELLDRYPGPTPVLFGDAEHRDAIASELAAGAGAGHGAGALRADEQAVAAAAAKVERLSAAVDAALELEVRAAELPQWQPLVAALEADAPGAFEDATDLEAAAALADRAGQAAGGWWQRVRGWYAVRRLRSALGSGRTVPVRRLRDAIEAGRCTRAAGRLAASGGTDLGAVWRALLDADDELAGAVGTAMRHRAASTERWDRAARRSAASLASALRAGRNRRRELLANLDGDALVRALPLWVGTATDTGDLLPPVPGMFDLVILDEASHLDQLRAAPVLARAKRALVVGDPRQLRFVSFVADVDIAATLHRHGLDDRVDVRRVSAFDLAAGAAPVTWLDEHFRSVPHLIEFSAQRFYSGRLAVATRHPANESVDVIDVVRVPDATVNNGANRAEVEAAIRAVRDLAADGATGIAVVSPFRTQADALEAALMNAFEVAELDRLGLRVGTVHAFQGSEASTVVASLGLVDRDSAARKRFVADPNLFNVLVTRARQRMIVVTSLADGADGLVADYLAFSAQPPPRPGGAGTGHEWTAALAAELRRAGLAVRGDYPVGRWRVDLCVGEGGEALGLATRVHPDGPAAHRARHRSLSRAGWRLVDAFASRWGGDPVRAALDPATSPPLPSTNGRETLSEPA